MNHLVVDESKKKLYEYLDKIQQLEEEISSSLFVLNQTLSVPEEKDRTWQNLEKRGEIISKEIVKELHKLESTYFSAESEGLKENKVKLVNQYRNLLNALNEKKSYISEQREKKSIPIVPFHQEDPQVGYCYSCKISISNKFSYQLEKGLQKVLQIKIVEGAKFCSKDCLSKYCEKYKKWKNAQQAKRKVHQDKIIQGKKILTHLQEEKTRLQEKSNTLKKREQEAELLYREEVLTGGEKKVSGWRKFLCNLGLAKDNSLRANLNHLRKIRQRCELELERIQTQIQEVLLKLTTDEQFDQEWEETEKNFLRLSEKENE